MIWCSGWKLASSVSNAGGLGLIGAASMYPQVLSDHILKCKDATDNPFGVNLPLMYPDIDEHINTIIKLGVKIVFTSAGSPKRYTSLLKSHGITVAHVVSNLDFAIKSEESGVDAVVCEGFEAGGHNGKDEVTTMCLIPNIANKINVPIIAAGGIGSGISMLAAFCLGADGVQIGSRFAVSKESSAHINFKNKILALKEGDTILSLKKLNPVRLVKNEFYNTIFEAEQRGSSINELQDILGKGRAKRGIFEGDLEEGELEIGQVSSMINGIKTSREIIDDLMSEFNEAHQRISNLDI